jgi:oligopeptide transport system substrate-binding protein
MSTIKKLFWMFVRFILTILLILIAVPVGYGVYRYAAFEPLIHGVPEASTMVTSYYESKNPRDYDPHVISTANNMSMLYSGLVALDAQSQVIPDLAESWQVSSDNRVYTFVIRENAVFHSGRKVVAQDVKYSLDRAASKELQSYAAPTYLGDIVGFDAYNTGESTSLSGVKVMDERTIEITIDTAKPYFLYKLTYPTAFVLDKQNIDLGAEWYKKPNGTGPYVLQEWNPGESQLYKAFDKFYLGAPNVPFILYQKFDEYDQDLYEQNKVDFAYAYSRERFMQESEPLHAELQAVDSMCTGYIVFDVTQPPFDDVHVRRAITMATDRAKYIDKMYDGYAIANAGLYPQGLPGFDAYLKALPYSPEAAREELRKSKYANDDIQVEFTDGGYGNYASMRMSLIGQMWKDTLGVQLSIKNIESDYYYDKINRGEHGPLFEGGWCADYPDPENFADALFHSDASQNRGNYSNESLDTILEKARTEQDVDSRIALYQEAERIIVQDAPVLFTAQPTRHYLIKPYLRGYRFDNSSTNEREITLDGKKFYMFMNAMWAEMSQLLTRIQE